MGLWPGQNFAADSTTSLRPWANLVLKFFQECWLSLCQNVSQGSSIFISDTLMVPINPNGNLPNLPVILTSM